ncbi:MAG: hypothetical protein IJI43_01125 [Bacilli bacterium]|nr:hypothetical protein [Bacilli bacterium]
MYAEKYIKFLKENNLYDQDLIDYMSTRTTYVDYNNENAKEFIGCYLMTENDVIEDIALCVPRIVDDVTVSINIHEYVHLLNTYKYLGKKYVIREEDELLPVKYELLYLKKENPTYMNSYIQEISKCNNKVLKEFISSYDKTLVKKK